MTIFLVGDEESMKYPQSQIRKANNGYIIQQRNDEYVFDNFIELVIVLADQYDEKEIVKELLLQCKQKYEEGQIEITDNSHSSDTSGKSSDL